MLWRRVAVGSFLPLPERACSGPFTGFCKGRGLSDWWRRFGRWSRYEGGRLRRPQSEMLRPYDVDSFPANFFQHLGIDIATADDGDVEFGFRELIATEQETGHGYGSAGLSHGRGS